MTRVKCFKYDRESDGEKVNSLCNWYVTQNYKVDRNPSVRIKWSNSNIYY
jgi:hypothetical protein